MGVYIRETFLVVEVRTENKIKEAKECTVEEEGEGGKDTHRVDHHASPFEAKARLGSARQVGTLLRCT